MKQHILIIDDDSKLNRLLTEYFVQFGYRVSSYTDPLAGLRQIKRELPDAVVLDVMLPEMDGFEVCREIRKNHSVPIIMLTARGDVTDRIVGLELGADDYMPKPFEPRELVARIQSVLRRTSDRSPAEVRRYGDLTINLNKHLVTIKDRKIDLTTAEYELLVLFGSVPARVLNRDQILDSLRGIEWDAFNRSVDVLVSRLRQKLGDDPKHPQYIKTVWGSGYMFIAEASEGI